MQDIIDKVRRTLYLNYYESYVGAMSYQTGGCYDLARFISGYLSKFKIEHEICVLSKSRKTSSHFVLLRTFMARIRGLTFLFFFTKIIL